MPPPPLTDQWLTLKHHHPLTFSWRGTNMQVSIGTGHLYEVRVLGHKLVKLCRKTPLKPARWWIVGIELDGRVISRWRHHDELPNDEYKSLRACIAAAADFLCAHIVEEKLAAPEQRLGNMLVPSGNTSL